MENDAQAAPTHIELQPILIDTGMILLAVDPDKFEQQKLSATTWAQRDASWNEQTEGFRKFLLYNDMPPMTNFQQWKALYHKAEEDDSVIFEYKPYGIRCNGTRQELTDHHIFYLSISLFVTVILRNIMKAFNSNGKWTPPIMPLHINVQDIPATPGQAPMVSVTAQLASPVAGWEGTHWETEAPANL